MNFLHKDLLKKSTKGYNSTVQYKVLMSKLKYLRYNIIKLWEEFRIRHARNGEYQTCYLVKAARLTTEKHVAEDIKMLSGIKYK